jgi:hypothetical protein
VDFETLRSEMQTIVDHRRFLENFVLPDYQQLCISNIASVAGKAFSISSLQKSNLPENYLDNLRGVEKVLLIVLDGLGYNRILAHTKKYMSSFYNLADHGTLHPLTSTFPSTTSTALTSIFTALPPSEHGIIGFNMFMQAYGLIINTLDMRSVYGFGHGLDFAEDFSKDIYPWLSTLTDHGIKTQMLTRRNLVGSGLSKVIHKHQNLCGYALVSDLFMLIRKLLEQPGPMFICAYYGGIDTVEHTYGPYSEESTAEIRTIENLLKETVFDRLPFEVKANTLLVITADHGVVKTEQTHSLNNPQISSHCLIPPTGDLRTAFFFPTYGHDAELREALKKNIQGFTILPSKDLIKNEAFGPVKDSYCLQNSIGTITALSQSKNSVFYQHAFKTQFQTLHGAHGGMTPEEMIVPLLSTRLSKL